MISISSSSEIPQFRLPFDAVSFEIELVKDLGVKVNLYGLNLFKQFQYMILFTYYQMCRGANDIGRQCGIL